MVFINYAIIIVVVTVMIALLLSMPWFHSASLIGGYGGFLQPLEQMHHLKSLNDFNGENQCLQVPYKEVVINWNNEVVCTNHSTGDGPLIYYIDRSRITARSASLGSKL